MSHKGLYSILILIFSVFQLYSQTPNPVGDAEAIPFIENCFRVTDEVQNQNGAVWYSEQLDLTEGFGWFSVYIRWCA